MKILFIRPKKSSFVQEDLKILEKHFDVEVVDSVFTLREVLGTFISLLEILYKILSADIVFSWFAEAHAYYTIHLAKLLGKGTYIVVAGWEVVNAPEIGYGALQYPKTAKMVRYIIENATKILAVSDYSMREVQHLAIPQSIEILYNGVDCETFKPGGMREDIVLTTAIINESRIALKGLDTFIKCSVLLPNVRFVIIGGSQDNSINRLKDLAGSNVEFVGQLTGNELVRMYQRSKVYCQLSYVESFGMALAEAMACGCVPVTTDRGALPEVVGEAGFIVPYGDAEATTDAIQLAFNSNSGHIARTRVVNNFSLEMRETGLLRILKKGL